jgi:hypothetical protein
LSDLVLRVKSWSDFQHYKDRSPAWIKLHRTLLDNIDFYKLSDCAGRTLVLLWLIASENDGRVPEIKEAAWRLRMSPEKMTSIYEELTSGGFVVNEEEPAKEKWGSRYIPDTVRDEVLERDGHKCKWCSSGENLEIDHIVPVSQGGESVADNLQVLCRSCNRKKRTRTAESAEQVATQVRSPEKRREEDIQREQKPLAAVAAVSPQPHKPEILKPEPSQHATLRQMAQDKWLQYNPEVPTCPWGPAEGNQLKLLIGKTPRWPTSQYAQCMENLFDSDGFSVSTPPAEWLVKLPKYLKGPLNEYGKSQTRRLSKADERLERIHEANRQVIGEVIRDAELYGSNAEAGIVSSGEKVLAVGPRELSRRNS